MAQPFVSVLIDTYNHERFIEQAVVSALEQDFPASDREILVVDDGSTDRTPEILHKFAPQVRLLRKANGGQASAFNVGIPECRGEIVAFLDGDDWWARGKLTRVAAVLSDDPRCGVVGHGIVNAFEGGTQAVDAPSRPERLRLESVSSARVFRLRKSFLGTSRMTLRRDLAARILPIPEALVIEADEYIFTLAAALSDLRILPEVLTYYRQHGGNLYNAAGGNAVGLRRKQTVTQVLACALRQDLQKHGVAADTIQCVCEILEHEARQMRLMLDGGSPWQTFRTETSIYGIMHGDAPYWHRLFRAASMMGALVLPPRWFYRARAWLGSKRWYRHTRKKILPVPKITNVAASEEVNS